MSTIIQTGSFISNGVGLSIPLRQGVAWFRCYNTTQIAATPNPGRCIGGYYQVGMPAGQGISYNNFAGNNITLTNIFAAGTGFSLYNTSLQNMSAPRALTAVNNANPPVVTSTPATADMYTGMVVRMLGVTGAAQLAGMDFTVAITGGNTFNLTYMSPIVAGTNGLYRIIYYPPLFAPSIYYITAITLGSPTVIKLSVQHQLVVGQQVRISIPDPLMGTTQLDGLSGEVIATSAVNNTISLNIDSTGFTAFQFPLTAYSPISNAMIIPYGEGSAVPNALDDAVYNTSQIGINLAGGAQSPAGSANDVIYWETGTSIDL
jgi:hypothetical protein